jgi:hypothetical protein
LMAEEDIPKTAFRCPGLWACVSGMWWPSVWGMSELLINRQ